MDSISNNLKAESLSLIQCFSIVEDPRVDRSKQYPLLNVLVFSFIAILSGQNSWYQIEEFCKETLSWFSDFLDVSAGVPSHDTFRRVFCLIDSQQFEKALIEWIENLRRKQGIKNRVLALDGKSLRGVSWKTNVEQLHILNAWDCTEQKFAGQLRVGSKTNEITAAPKLLNMMNLENTIVTMDAMMTQKEIADVIMKRQGNYLMALKGNQGTLFEDVKLYFTEIMDEMSSFRTLEKNRGQVEIRTCTKTEEVKWLNQYPEWKGLKALFQVESEISLGNKVKKEKRYYITSLNLSAKDFLHLSRAHWSIENHLHRTLDVHFQEDASQEHDHHAATNLSILRKLALSLLKQVEPKKALILKIRKAAYSPEFRKKCLLNF